MQGSDKSLVTFYNDLYISLNIYFQMITNEIIYVLSIIGALSSLFDFGHNK